jgi:hypothetical protein
LPAVAQLFEILLRGPVCAFDVLSGVVASQIVYAYIRGFGTLSCGLPSVSARRTSVY